MPWSMMSALSASSDDIDLTTAHDFNSERLLMMVLGGYVLVKRPSSRLALNLLYLASVCLVFVYLICMALVTVLFTALHKAILVQVLQTLCLLCVGLALPGSKLITESSMQTALHLIKRGVHRYRPEVADPEHDRLKGARVEQVRSLMSWVTRLTFCCAVSNTFVLPLLQLLSAKDQPADSPLNPYLPLPIYMPFDTSRWLGFLPAFLTNAVFFFFLYATITCLIETYLSCSLQLIAQLEILNYSLKNIERRAFLKLLKYDYQDANLTFTEDLYEDEQFQRHLYYCLRENILHHHAILKLTKAVSPFLEAINSICIMSFSIVLAASIILILENPTMNVALISTLTSDIYCYYEMCRVGQVVTDKSTEVTESLYSTPWPKCHKKFKVLLNIMLSNTQKPIIIKAIGFNASASLGTYADMMTLGYKIMNVLR